MCEANLIYAGIALVTSAAASHDQNKRAEQQQEAINLQAKYDLQQTSLRQGQEHESKEDQLLELRRAALVEQEAIRAQAASSGVSGNTITRILRRQRSGAADAESSILRQDEVDALQLGQQAEAIVRGATAQIESTPTVGATEGLLTAAGAGAQAYFAAGGTLGGDPDTGVVSPTPTTNTTPRPNVTVGGANVNRPRAVRR